MRAEPVAPPGLGEILASLFLGLTPQAKHLPPLRGSEGRSSPDQTMIRAERRRRDRW
jgi:hypothetical protein